MTIGKAPLTTPSSSLLPLRYRKLPVTVEVWQLTDENSTEIIHWMLASEPRCPAIKADNLRDIIIPTLEGEHLARVGDWIARGVQGEFWPIKPAIFTETYEPIPDLWVEWIEDETDIPGWFVCDAEGPREGSYALRSEAEEALRAV